MDAKTHTQIIEQLQETLLHAQHALTLLQKSADGPYDQMGDVAHQHLTLLEQNKSLTVKESREIRRALYGTKMRATANLFGVEGSGALFYRQAEFGSRVKADQQVRLTKKGLARAKDFRLANGLA